MAEVQASALLSEWYFLVFAKLIRFWKANYLTFGGLLSPNACEIWRSVEGRVDFFEYLSVKQFSVFQLFAK